MYAPIINALAGSPTTASKKSEDFCVSAIIKPGDISIEVKGIGPINFPLSTDKIHQLLSLSNPAKYGLKDKTLLDKKVRNTQEISADNLIVSVSDKALTPMLKKMRENLGLPENAVLKAHLHNMLIYGPDQFFKKHQDTEKHDGMIASLVLVLPSPHIGGDLVVTHRNKEFSFKTENIDAKEIKALAFYADCVHEVEKVQQGYRVALTYNLVLEVNEAARTISFANSALIKALKDFFVLDEEIDEGCLPLVYFLDHEYTEHSLHWSLLKGNDAKNGADFLYAAEELGLKARLALVEHHESWSAYGDERNPLPEELIDDDTELTFWVDEKSHKLPYSSLDISTDEACWSIDTEDFEPYESEYEGFMGNYGETVDYWYRRAAIVLWPNSDDIVMEFKLNNKEAIRNLVKLTKEPGKEQQIRKTINRVGKHFYSTAMEREESQFSNFATIACYLNDSSLAETILKDFACNVFNHNVEPSFAQLEKIYGTAWCLRVMDKWRSNDRSWYTRNTIEKDPEELIRRILQNGLSTSIVEYLLEYLINTTIKENKLAAGRSVADRRKEQKSRISRMKQLICACDLLENDKFRQSLVEHIASYGELYPNDFLAEMILKVRNAQAIPPESLFNIIAEQTKKRIKSELDNGPPDENDNSIRVQMRCSCSLCTTAKAFLESKAETKKIWPIIQADRSHVQEQLRWLDVPVKASVLKEGSPHKLVLEKSNQLYPGTLAQYLGLKQSYEALCLM